MAENDGTSQGTGENKNDAGGNDNQQQTTSSTSTNDTGSTGQQGMFNAEQQRAMDAIIRDRIAREREKYKDFDDLKSKASKFDELQAASQTDLEKAQGSLAKAEERATNAEARLKASLFRAAIISEGSRQGARDPELLVKLVDTKTLTIDDDDNVGGAAEAVTALLASHDYLKGNGFTGNGDGGQRTSSGVPTFTRDQIADPTFFREHQKEIMAAQRAGRITE